MTNLQDKDYWLSKAIEQEFRRCVDPESLCDHLAGQCLTDADVDEVFTVCKNEGKSEGAGELLDHLRRRPNWVHCLSEICKHPDLKLGHLGEVIRQKTTELKIKITIQCSDGKNCGEEGTVEEVLSNPATESQVSEIGTAADKFLVDFKARVDPKTFLQYLTRFKEVDQDAVKCKHRQQGRSAAADELVSRLLGYKNWKDDLQEALGVPGNGLEDLENVLSNIKEEEFQTELHKAASTLKKSSQGISLKERRKQIIQDFVHQKVLEITPDRNKLQEVLSMAADINAFLINIEKGSLIITLQIRTIETLEAVNKLYLGGLLAEAFQKDLLSESRVHHIQNMVEKNGITASELKQYVSFDDLGFDVEINPVDFQYCLLHLTLFRDVSIPATPIQSAAQFEFSQKGNGRDSNLSMKIGPNMPPVIRMILADPFIQGRYHDVIPLLECSPTEMYPVKLIQWLYKELDDFVTSHRKLLDLGSGLANADEQLRHLFQISQRNDSVEILFPTGNRDPCVTLDITTWKSFLEEGIIDQSEQDQMYRFCSSLLEQFVIHKSDASSSTRLNRFFLVFKMAENPTNFSESISGFQGDPSLKMEHLFLHYLLMKEADPARALDVLKTIVPTEDIFGVDLSKDSIDSHLDVLHVLVQEKLIDKFETSLDLKTAEIWDINQTSERKSISISNMGILVKLVRAASSLGTVQTEVTANLKGERLADIQFKPMRERSLTNVGYSSLKLCGESLSPGEVDSFCSSLLHLPNLYMLDLSKTSNLKPGDYRKILKACRYSQISSLVLSDTDLLDQDNPQAIGLQYLPNLKSLELERCKLGDKGLHAMASDFKAASKLTELSVAQNNITSSGIVELSALLMDKGNLRIVRVHENAVGFEGALALAVLFRNLPFLEVINLCNCKGIHDNGFQFILDSLHGKNLKKMNVRNCRFSQRTAKKFFNVLKYMPHFQHLDYGCNSIGETFGSNSEISELFLEMMSCNKNSWDHLSLWNCHLGLTSVFSSSDRLSHLSTLTDICLQENSLNDRDGICLGEYLDTSWHSLRVLNLRHNNIGDTGASRILDGVRRNPNMKEFYLDRNAIQNIDMIIKMTKFFLEKNDNASLREMDISYNEVSESHRYQQNIRRDLGDVGPVRIRDCAGYMELSTEDRILRV